jgi:hypothetical protein
VPYNGIADAINKNFFMVKLALTSNIWQDFRQGMQMGISVLGSSYQFNLTGTSRMMLDLKSCVEAEKIYEAGGAVPRFVSNAAVPPAVSAVRSPITTSVVRETNPNAVLELAATRITTNLLLQARLPNARLIPSSDAPEYVRGRGAAWKADGSSGSVVIFPRGIVADAQTAATQVVQSDSNSCKGDFASVRSQDLVDGKIVTRVATTCKASSITWTIRYFILDGEQDGWIVYAVVGGEPNPTRPEDQPMSDANFQSAAVRSTNYH